MSTHRFGVPRAAAWPAVVIGALVLACAGRAAITPGQIAYVAGPGGALHIYVQDAAGGAAAPLTSGFDQDLGPAWSPNGQRIAFVGFLSGQGDIYVSDGSGPAIPLTSDAESDTAPAWSPDGTQIAFAKTVTPCCPAQSQIFVMNSDGSSAHPLVSTATDDTAPLWSADGTKIGFTARNANGQTVGHPVVNLDGSAPSPAVTFLGTGWAPAGTRYVSSPSSENIVLSEIGGPSQTVFPDDAGLASSATFGPSLSPGCDAIAFIADSVAGGTVTTDLYVMGLDGSRTRRVTNDGSVKTVAWKPLPGSGCPPATTGNTPTGSSVDISPVDTTTGTSPVAMTFKNVTVAGSTTLSTSSTGPTPPAGFSLGAPATYYGLSTTATFSSVILCFSYAGISFPGTPRLFHFEGGAWVDVTRSVNTISQVVCAEVTSLSPFALFVSVKDQLAALLLGIVNDSKVSPAIKAVLVAKIQSLVASFDPANPLQRALVCRGLSALVVAARALAGHGLTAERAAQIVADADRVRAVLGC